MLVQPVLVDTSIWIDFYRHKGFLEPIQEWAREGCIATCGLIQAELFPFIRTKRRQVEAFFQKMTYLHFRDEWWASLISYRNKVVTHGLDIGIPDLILITLCKHHDAILFSKDPDFSRVQGILEFQLLEIKS